MAQLSLSSLFHPLTSSVSSVPSCPLVHCHRRILPSPFRIRAAASSSDWKPQVVVTRERGKNGKLINALVNSISLDFFCSLFQVTIYITSFTWKFHLAFGFLRLIVFFCSTWDFTIVCFIFFLRFRVRSWVSFASIIFPCLFEVLKHVLFVSCMWIDDCIFTLGICENV